MSQSRRLEYLEERVEEDPSLTWDRAEAAALRFALAVIAGAEETGTLEDLHERDKALMSGPAGWQLQAALLD